MNRDDHDQLVRGLVEDLEADAEFADWLENLRSERADIDDLDPYEDGDRKRLVRLCDLLGIDVPDPDAVDEDGAPIPLSEHFAGHSFVDAYDNFREAEGPLSAERKVTIEVTLGTGGPANGVTFYNCGDGDFQYAQAWWQDWFTSKTYHDLDNATASTLWTLWDLDLLCEEDR